MNSSSGFPARRASSASLSRSGPTAPWAPAGLKVWHPSQPLFTNTVFPETVAEAPAPAPLAQLVNLSRLVTIDSERIRAWPRPQSSVQMTGKVPSRWA